jgi:hypothetical protein
LEEKSVKKGVEEPEMEVGNVDSEDEESEEENLSDERDLAYEVDETDMEEDEEEFMEEDIG